MAGAADSLLEPRPPARAAVKTLHCTVWITLQHSPSAWFDYYRLQQEEKNRSVADLMAMLCISGGPGHPGHLCWRLPPKVIPALRYRRASQSSYIFIFDSGITSHRKTSWKGNKGRFHCSVWVFVFSSFSFHHLKVLLIALLWDYLSFVMTSPI